MCIRNSKLIYVANYDTQYTLYLAHIGAQEIDSLKIEEFVFFSPKANKNV